MPQNTKTSMEPMPHIAVASGESNPPITQPTRRVSNVVAPPTVDQNERRPKAPSEDHLELQDRRESMSFTDNPLVAGNIPSSPPNAALPPTRTLVTECSTVYSILMALITTSYTCLIAYFAYTGDEKVYSFWWWIHLPTSFTGETLRNEERNERILTL